jgi:hypothetical protein
MGAAWARHGRGMGAAWARHGMCKLALTQSLYFILIEAISLCFNCHNKTNCLLRQKHNNII